MHVSYTARDGGPDLKASVSTGLLDALNDPRPSRLFSLRQEFPDAWNQLINPVAGATRTCTLQLSKQHFRSVLDYAWPTPGDHTTEPRPITLDLTALTAYLSPRGSTPEDAVSLTLNQRPVATDPDLGIPTFDLALGPGALSSTSIGNADTVTCQLSIDGPIRAADWNDLFLLMDYRVRT
jgi:hypothetical protein